MPSLINRLLLKGPSNDPGINSRALERLFNEAELKRRSGWTIDISVSLVEIYNEVIRDLLDISKQKLAIRSSTDGFIGIPGLTEISVNSPAEISKVLAKGKHNRKTSSTNLNQESSRSHAILRANVRVQHKVTGISYVGRLLTIVFLY